MWSPTTTGPPGELEVWMSTQGPHEARRTFARVSGVPERHVHVRMGDVGGGFGQKFFTFARGAGRRGRGPRIWASRSSGSRTGGRTSSRRPTPAATSRPCRSRSTPTAGSSARSSTTSRRPGAWPVGGTGGTGPFAAMLLPGPYKIPGSGGAAGSCGPTPAVAARTAGRGCSSRSRARRSWTSPRGDRASTRSSSGGATSSATTSSPFATATGMSFDNVTPATTLEHAVAGHRLRRRSGPSRRAAREEGRLLGLGIGLYIEPTSTPAATLGVEAATVRVESGGAVTVFLGTGCPRPEHRDHDGPGGGRAPRRRATTTSRVVQGDTDRTPFGGGTGGSRTAVIAGNATRDAALQGPRHGGRTSRPTCSKPRPRTSRSPTGVVVAVRGTPVRNVVARRHRGGACTTPARASRPTRRACSRPPVATRRPARPGRTRATSARSRSTRSPVRSRSCATS